MKQEKTLGKREKCNFSSCIKMGGHVVGLTWKWKLAAMLALILYEGIYFRWQCSNVGDKTVVDILRGGYLQFAFMLIVFAFVLIDISVHRVGKSKIQYLYTRTGISMEESVAAIVVVSAMWYVLLWSSQTLILIGYASCFRNLVGPERFGSHTMYMMFQTSTFASMIFPLSSPTGFLRNTLLVMLLSMITAVNISESLYGYKMTHNVIVYVFVTQMLLRNRVLFDSWKTDVPLLAVTIVIYAVLLWYKYYVEGGKSE